MNNFNPKTTYTESRKRPSFNLDSPNSKAPCRGNRKNHSSIRGSSIRDADISRKCNTIHRILRFENIHFGNSSISKNGHPISDSENQRLIGADFDRKMSCRGADTSRSQMITLRDYRVGNGNFDTIMNDGDGPPFAKKAKYLFNNSQRQKQNRASKVYDFYQTKNLLTQMLQGDYSENIALQLLDPAIRMKNFLDNITNQSEEVVKNIIKVTLKASENKLMESNFRDLLTLVISSKFSTERLDTFISSELRQSLNMEMFHLVILYFKLVFRLLPALAFESLKSRADNLLLFADYLMLRNAIIDKEVLSHLNELKILIENSFRHTSKGKIEIRNKIIFAHNLDPPDDFRQINIFPNAEDLNLHFKEVFLRKNKKNGIYESVDDYLDVQFRLMREDFIQPLREGLEHVKHDHDTKGLGIRIYRKVTIINTLPAGRLGIIHHISFDSSRFKRVNWIHSKRFLYGSLLCLSSDNFETLLFATVANREIKDLEKGIISVKFFDCEPAKDSLYTIVETTNMFESYRHVLQKLQETNDSNLCLQKYLVFADENIAFPRYLDRNRESEYVFCNKKFSPGMDELHWPRVEEFQLDESQYKAFKTGLTKEIAIIQGPPGTGKTFLGFQLCHCLLENVQKRIEDFGPILVVCYTNHALDQFLEGILQFTKKIIRIGNRCKSEILQNFSLVKWKMESNQVNTSNRKKTVFAKMCEIKNKLLELQASLKLSNDSFLSLNKLSPFIKDSHYYYLQDIGIQNWLSGQSEQKNILDSQLENLVEWIIYNDTIDIVKSVAKESRCEVMNNNENEYTYDNDIEVNYINNSRRLDIDVDEMNDVNQEFENKIRMLREDVCDDYIPSIYDDGFKIVRSKGKKQFFQKWLRSHDKMTREEACALGEIDDLDIKSRWKLYHYWKSRYVESFNENSKKLENEYESYSKKLNELGFEEDRQIMMRQDIIGMTTTGAARYGRVLSQIQCKIIIVEEAAEVLESHIIGSLNPGCEHLILIGDHKQLKPNPTVYELARSYNLDLSLFERLINNNLHFNTLELQHRMRPEIADIMKHIYKNLKNHESVLTYPNVPAVSTNIFFFNHTEQETLNEEISSYSNKFEAEFIVSFCLHLMKNGIENTQITILTLYSGQLFVLKSMMPKKTFEGVRVCVVDNYQGEENDIIILSLVRSNELEKIGFLSIENRICVSLSRAKHGLFVFGNFQLLTNQSKLWKDICFDLKQKNLMGDKLVLLCQNHPQKRLEVNNPDDFKKYPEGGCTQICNQRLICGHACRKACHFLDKNHQKVKCLEKCTKLCANGHPCDRKCWQECRGCSILVIKKFPNCDHKQLMQCHIDPQPDNCTSECERLLQCGHKCLRRCRKKCGYCFKRVLKVSPECQHEGEYSCSDEILFCPQKCNEILDCEHPCAGTCGQCNMGRLHVQCNDRCQNQLICGHVCKAPCSSDCPPCNEKCEEGCVHNVCPKRCGDECVPCLEKCKWKCKHMRCTRKCYEECDRNMCNVECKKNLYCRWCNKRFQCYGVCGEPCRKTCFKCDPEVKEIFFGTEDDEDAKFITLWTCGHSFETESMDKYMNMVNDDGEIVQKRCPKCKTVITKRSCFRYLNIVRKIFSDIKKVQSLTSKNKENTNFFDFVKRLEVHSPKLKELFRTFKVANYFSTINREMPPLSNHDTSKYTKSLDMAFELYKRFYRRFLKLNSILDIDFQYIQKSVARLLEWLNPARRKFGQFDITQYACELDRIEYILKLTEKSQTHPLLKEIPDFIEELKKCKSFANTFSFEFKKKWKTFMDQKGDLLPNMGITEIERKQIVSAIGLGKGRWYKCPNGHYYVIGECGGANQVTKCSECDALVGGEHHRLRDDNQLAGEMDGAQYPAFSDQANLANYVDVDVHALI